MLTNGNLHGLKILEGLHQAGISLDAVVLETQPRITDCMLKRGGAYVFRLIKATRRWVLSRIRIKKFSSTFGRYSKIIKTGPLNSNEMQKSLEEICPDFIVLGGIGIIGQNIINTARHGVLNSHPGLLPWLRGTGVVARAIERGIPIGGTCHFVDCKVDTGRVIERCLLNVEGNYSLEDLERMADDLVVRMMVELVQRLVVQGAVPDSFEQTTKFPVCKWVSMEERAHIEKLVRAGEAAALFKKWQNLCVEQDSFILKQNSEVHAK